MNYYRSIWIDSFVISISLVSAPERIVGGRDVLEGEFPSYVALLDQIWILMWYSDCTR